MVGTAEILIEAEVISAVKGYGEHRTRPLRRSNMSARPRVRTVWLLTRPAGRIMPFPYPAPSRRVCRPWASLRSQSTRARLLRICGRASAASKTVFLSFGWLRPMEPGVPADAGAGMLPNGALEAAAGRPAAMPGRHADSLDWHFQLRPRALNPTSATRGSRRC